jgi:hypothetical protein
MGTFISFGYSGKSAGGSMMPGPTTDQDGIVVTEDLSDVAHALATMGQGSWPRFTRSWAGDDIPVHVNPASVTYITEIEIR